MDREMEMQGMMREAISRMRKLLHFGPTTIAAKQDHKYMGSIPIDYLIDGLLDAEDALE